MLPRQLWRGFLTIKSKKMKRLIFIFSVIGVINSYLAFSTLQKFSLIGFSDSKTVICFFVSLFLLQIIAILFGWAVLDFEPRTRLSKIIFFTSIRTSHTAFGIASCLLVYVAMADIIFIVCAFLSIFIQINLVVIVWCLLVFIAVTTLISSVIGLIDASFIAVKKVEVHLEKLPKSFDGFRIAQISDLHIGPLIKRRFVQKVVNITNSLEVDLVALTGDMIDGEPERLSYDTAPLAYLTSKHGSFFVTGNHEYYWNVHSWINEFKRLGFNVLANENRVINNGFDQIAIAGVNDFYSLYSNVNPMNPALAAKDLPQDMTKILLAHQPKTYDLAQKADFDLMLSGHTHGGQYFPFTFLIKFFQPYYRGLNRYKNLQIYVNRGTGFWGPPLRTGGFCEITLIILKSAN